MPEPPAALTDWSWPHFTNDVPRIVGTLKEQPEDFLVEEIPRYEPSGEGEHLFVWIEKRDVAAEELTAHIARTLGISRQEVGMAGLKDKRAITRQYVSIPASCESRLAELETDQIQIDHARRHTNKLRPGHLAGNRFSILVATADPQALTRAEEIAAQVGPTGAPNYFGDQRFGRDAQTVLLGWRLLKGETTPQQLHRSRRKFLLKFALSAMQSLCFNRALADRLNAGTARTVTVGDVMQVAASGGPFVAEDQIVEQSRFDQQETVISGPLFGPKMTAPHGIVAEWERQILDDLGLTPDDFLRHRKLTPGSRRPYWTICRDFSLSADPRGVRFEFTLPPGNYATVALREFVDEA